MILSIFSYFYWPSVYPLWTSVYLLCQFFNWGGFFCLFVYCLFFWCWVLWDAESLLNGQCTKFFLQPLTLGSSRWRAEWIRDTWEPGVGGSGEKTEGTGSRIPVLSHSPSEEWRGYLSQAENFPQVVSAWGEAITSPVGILGSTLWNLSPAAEEYSQNTFTL